MSTRIGLIGLGLMGGAMARNLLLAGYSVIGHDIDPKKVEGIVKAGGKTLPPGQIPENVDAIMLSLPSSAIVDDVVKNTLKLTSSDRAEWDSATIISFYDELANVRREQ
jgi:3-hydroxyisobutyrate dehydrogenase-like beta-hydroxyacid dehydrogenase